MLVLSLLITALLSTISVTITEPVDGETYFWLDTLNVRAVVDLENEPPDIVEYRLNGGSPVQIDKLNTDWFTFMGSDYKHGFSESPAPLENTVLWTAPVTGDWIESASPVIVEGIVYYASNFGTDSLYALDAVTGDLIWKNWVGISEFPVSVCEGQLFIAADSLFCLDALTGESIWTSAVADKNSGAPIVANNNVYCGNIRTVYCLSKETGDVIWGKTLPSTQTSTLTVWNNIVFVPTFKFQNDASIFALDASTGEMLWKNTCYQGYCLSSPVIADSTLFINGADGYARSIDVFSGECNWVKDIYPGQEICSTPAYFDGQLFFGRSPYFYCLDAATGDIVWNVPGGQLGSSCIADGFVFYCETYNSNNARLIALDCDSGSEVWTFTTNNTSMQSSPSITDGIVYFAAEDWNLYAIGTGLRYTYHGENIPFQIGENVLVTTASWDSGCFVADTISFYIDEVAVEHMNNGRINDINAINLCTSQNPFSTLVDLTFTLNQDDHCSIEIYDMEGRFVISLMNSVMTHGMHSITWDGSNKSGEIISSGLYFCRIESGGVVETTSMCFLR